MPHTKKHGITFPERRSIPRVLATPSPDARRWLFVSDLTAALAVAFLISAFRRLIGINVADDSNAAASHVLLFVVFDLLLVLRLGMYGQYQIRQRFSRIDDLTAVVQAAFMGAAMAVFLSLATKGFFTGFTDYSRSYTALVLLLTFLVIGGGRIVLHARQERLFNSGRFLTKALIVGTGERTDTFLRFLGDNPTMGVLGVRSQVDVSDADIEHFSTEVGAELDAHEPHEVLIAFDEPRPDLQEALVRECAVRAVTVRSLPGVFNTYKRSYFEYAGLPMATIFETSQDIFARRIKRIFDIAASGLGIIFLSPFLAIIALLILIEDGTPVFYRQERIGLYGSSFHFWKFRTMRTDGDARLADYLAAHPEAQEEWDQFQKLKNDPRLTRIGGFLRKTSIDELPQLINVFFGEMSLVGPRPPMIDQGAEYGTKFVFSQVRPGITGLWQVSGRNEIDFEGRIDLDVYYVENWTIWLDMKILLKTFLVVLRRDGAY